MFQSAGYATAHFGKWQLREAGDAPPPDAYGIDVHKTLLCKAPPVPWEPHDGFNSRLTARYVDEALNFFRQHQDEPFYLNLWTLLPHAPLTPLPEEIAQNENLPLAFAESARNSWRNVRRGIRHLLCRRHLT